MSRVDNPNHVPVETFSTSRFVFSNRGVLNLDDESAGSLDIRYMLLMRPIVYVHHFLTVDGKCVFPVSVTIGLGFLPWISGNSGFVSPMPPNVLTTLSDHVIATKAAFAANIWCGFGTNVVNECQSHNYLTFPRLRFLADSRETKGDRIFSYNANKCSTRSRSDSNPARR